MVEYARLCPAHESSAPRPAAPSLEGDPRLLLELAQPMLAVARAQTQLHAQWFAEEAAAAAREEAKMEAAAARLGESYYGLVAQRAHLEQELVRRGGAWRVEGGWDFVSWG